MKGSGGGGVAGGVRGGMSLEQAKRARKGFKGGVEGEVAGNVLAVPKHASLFSLVADIPSPTSSVPMFNLD